MKLRAFLLPTLALFAALACNLPFGRPAEQAAATVTPLVLPTSAPALSPTQPPAPGVAPSLAPPTALPSPVPSATPQTQATALPTAAPPVVVHNPYAVILVAENDVLNVRQAPGANQPVVATLPPTATGIRLTGQERRVTDDRWVEISLPGGGTGWVNAYYLTEQVPSSAFCADPQAAQLIVRLRQALIDGDGGLLSSLVSPAHGLDLTYLRTGNTANYTSEEASWVFQSDYDMDWGTHPASGLKVVGTFQETALPDLLDVLAETFQTRCNSTDLGGGNYTYAWPARYRNINYLVLHKPGLPGNELSWRTWIAGIEYVDGRPYLFALAHLFWEP